ncbi:hypothetical protein N9954_03370 [Maribacter sp.]|nr:hypothetical protein [Maribacter sp.]
MIEDELIKIWLSSPEIEQVKFEKSRLILDMQSSLDRFNHLAKYALIIEQVAVIIIIPVFLFYVYFVPHLLSKIASIWIAIWACWYMTLLRKFKRAKPNSLNLDYIGYLKVNRAYMANLKKWADRSMYWYVLPPMSGFFIFIAGPYVDGAINEAFFIKLILIGLVTVILTYFYKRWAVKKIYMPRLKKIDELIKVMEE